jgi:hypothetical protein
MFLHLKYRTKPSCPELEIHALPVFTMSIRQALVVLFYICLSAVVQGVVLVPSNLSAPSLAKPPSFLLGGDSTTQTKTGWGDAFLSLIQKPATGVNFGRGGRTTVNYRTDSGGLPKLLAEVAKDAGQYTVYATLQVRQAFELL